jgi:pyruvate,orthophosphate dikinase
MARSAGILTSAGTASHAPSSRGVGIPAVVGAADVTVGDGIVVIGDRRLAAGDTITIDGSTGEVFIGAAAGVATVVPEAATLVSWARELGIEIGEAPEGPAVEAAVAAGGPRVAAPAVPGEITSDDALRVLAVKGYATPEALATALLASADEASAALDRLVADGLAEVAAGSFRLTADGKAIAKERIAADAESWGLPRAEAALDAFLTLDQRMKATVTAWQMRDVNGEQTFNDHSDPEYDATVLGDLAVLHREALAWLDAQESAPARLAAYRERLERANAAAQGGDQRYVASPRVDSYHGVWFELHEDLIQLAGRNRADEVAAGRA